MQSYEGKVLWSGQRSFGQCVGTFLEQHLNIVHHKTNCWCGMIRFPAGDETIAASTNTEGHFVEMKQDLQALAGSVPGFDKLLRQMR